MPTTPLKMLVGLALMLIVSGCEASMALPSQTDIQYIPCVSLPGPFPYVEEGVVWAESTLVWGDEYNAVWEALCEE